MSGYIAGLSCFALVLSPLYIQIGVTVAHSFRNWRAKPRVEPA